MLALKALVTGLNSTKHILLELVYALANKLFNITQNIDKDKLNRHCINIS